uniref:Uncharacterized protein n=1 Tax=Physcomitrium patens TaxID=3218 RepID=A0A7I4DF76_PHYPA
MAWEFQYQTIGITWRQSSPNTMATLGINAEVPSLMVSHGMTLLNLKSVEDDVVPNAVAALLEVYPVRVGEGEDDYIAVVLDASLCHHELCLGEHDKDVQFSNGFAEEQEDVLDAFLTVEAERDRVNAAYGEEHKPKASRQSRGKKSDVAVVTQDTGFTGGVDETAARGESSRPRMKKRSSAASMKDQVQLEREALGVIRRKLELYCIPVSKRPVMGGGPQEEGPSLILDRMPGKDEMWLVDDQRVPWWQTDVHWYVVGGQHTFQACVTIAAKEVRGSSRHKFYTEFDVVPVYSKDLEMLIKVSNALNIQVKDKVVTENFRSQLKNARAKWIKKGRPAPKKGGAKHDADFKAADTLHNSYRLWISKYMLMKLK